MDHSLAIHSYESLTHLYDLQATHTAFQQLIYLSPPPSDRWDDVPLAWHREHTLCSVEATLPITVYFEG